MTMTKEQAIDTLVMYGAFTETECKESDGGKFYVKNLMKGYDICDIDRYAWLNTLFQYDIGDDFAMKIDSWLWGSKTVLKDYPLGYETMELTYNDEEGKELLRKCDEELGMGLDFSKWIDYDPVSYQYF